MDTPRADKRTVEKILRDTARLLSIRGESGFRVRAYENAARAVGRLDRDLLELVEEDGFEHVPGIGPRMAEHIGEIVRTGRLGLLDQLRTALPPGLLELLQVPALGPRKVAQLESRLGVRSLDDLEAACRDGRLAALPGFGARTAARILDGVAEVRAREGRFLLSLARPLAGELIAWLRGAPSVEAAEVAGAVRRWREEAHDVELVAASQTPESALDRLAAHPDVSRIVERTPGRLTVLVAPGVPVRLHAVRPGSFAAALHHHTGSAAHHVKLRLHARSRGLRVGADGVSLNGTPVSVEDEATLYGLLGLQYVPPELREDEGEVEAARAGTLPDLLRPEDVVGLVHQHTLHSDGTASVLQMAEAARALGYAWLTVTEHSSAAHYANGVTPDRMQAVWDDVDRANERLDGFRVLKGAEVDILADGTLDYDDDLLSRLEVVIASVHQRFGQDEAAMTERLVRAVSHPAVHLLAHPTGRLIHQRAPVAARWDEVFAAAAEHGTALEVNGNPDRLDLNGAHVRQALAAGCRLSVSTDAHRVDSLHNVSYAVATARRGWARKADVINCAGADDFLAGLRAAKGR